MRRIAQVCLSVLMFFTGVTMLAGPVMGGEISEEEALGYLEQALQSGFDPKVLNEGDMMTDDISTPLCDAISRGWTKMVDRLLQFPEVNVNKGSGVLLWSPLVVAILSQDIDMVNKLLHAPKINVNVRDYMGFTPLMYAAASIVDNPITPVNKEMVKLLLENGADVTADVAGQTVFDLLKPGRMDKRALENSTVTPEEMANFIRDCQK